MRHLILLFCFFIHACDSNENYVSLVTEEDHKNFQALPGTHNSSGTQTLAVNWKPLQETNPFSTDLIEYEVWLNDRYLTTTGDTSIALALENPNGNQFCIRIRAVRYDIRSEFSDQSCYFGPD